MRIRRRTVVITLQILSVLGALTVWVPHYFWKTKLAVDICTEEAFIEFERLRAEGVYPPKNDDDDHKVQFALGYASVRAAEHGLGDGTLALVVVVLATAGLVVNLKRPRPADPLGNAATAPAPSSSA